MWFIAAPRRYSTEKFSQERSEGEDLLQLFGLLLPAFAVPYAKRKRTSRRYYDPGAVLADYAFR